MKNVSGFIVGAMLFSVAYGLSAEMMMTSNTNTSGSFLAEKGIIQNSNDYKLKSNITRREMLKVMMNLSGKDISENCEGKFQDLNASDWGCKYAEAALKNGFIAKNTNFRPDAPVSNIEALKMVMQARGIEKKTTSNICGDENGLTNTQNCEIPKWQDQYRAGAAALNLIDMGGDFEAINTPSNSFNYDDTALRGAVFTMASRTYGEFSENIKNWRTFQNKDFSVKYPESWVYKMYTNGDGDSSYGFGAIATIPAGLQFEVSQTSMNQKEFLESKEGKTSDITTITGVSGKRITIPASDGVAEQTFVYVSRENKNFIVSDGFSESPYFENFYKSFQIQK